MLNVTVNSVVRDVTVNLSAKDWQMYDSMEGAAEAAEKLNRAVEAAVRTNDRKTARSAIHAVMDELGDYGASDTEPRHVLYDVLDTVYGKA